MKPELPLAFPKELILDKLKAFLEMDIGFGDVSSTIIPPDAIADAEITAKSTGVVAGVEEVMLLCHHFGIGVKPIKFDGDRVESNDILFSLNGKVRDILMIERTILNLLMKMSSIATSVAELVVLIQNAGFSTKLAATRKLTPGFGWFEKKAAVLGGGDPHRWNLSDMVMLKDTHLKYYQNDIPKLLKVAKNSSSFSKKIEIEIENPQDLMKAIEAGADIIMFDNFDPKTIKAELARISDKKGHVLFEASGNITHENLVEYAASGVDIISTSQPIFHPHKVMDYSLRLK
jgi:nicotinate-nucleotide pyrophosphorylase (carboxylating)